MPTFRKATRSKSRLRMALDGPAGSGKTFTALRFAHALGKRIAVINSESGAVEKYLGLAPDGVAWDFDVCELDTFAPTTYSGAIFEAGRQGYEVLIIDSLSHAWMGKGGALEIVDKKQAKYRFSEGWREVTPMHNEMIEAILRSPCHVIATMRSKMEHVLEKVTDSQGRERSTIRKMGMAPVQRQGMEYEFDVVCDIDTDHILSVTKSRCPELDGKVVVKPAADFVTPLAVWLQDGSEAPPEAFATNEQDLKKFLNKQQAEQKQAAQAEPAKSAMDLLKEQAAAAAAAAATTSPPPQATTSPPPVVPPQTTPAVPAENVNPITGQVDNSGHSERASDPVNQERRDVIRSLLGSEGMGLDSQQIRKVLAKYGKPSFAELTKGEADQVIADARHSQMAHDFFARMGLQV